MAVADIKYCLEDSVYRKILYSPLKKLGFVPEKETEIFVSAIPTWVTVYDLARFFEQVGELFQVKLLVELDGVHNRGFGFVTYMNAKLAEKAMNQLSNKPFIGINCLAMQKSVNNCRIFVGGLPTSKTKDEIWQELMTRYNITNIVDVITYRNYSNSAHNRGFVFLEFRTHEEASYFRAKYSGKLILFGKTLLVDWSVPVLETDENIMAQVKIIFLRNLDVTLPSEAFARQVYQLISRNVVEKVYKFKNYAYIHLNSRQNAEKLLATLKSIYSGTAVEVSWAKPPNKFSERSFRDKALISRKAKSSMSSSPSRQRSNTLPYGAHLLALSDDISGSNQHLQNTILLSHSSSDNLFASGNRSGKLSSQNIFNISECTAYPSTSFTVNNHSRPRSSSNFVVPILPQNLIPFHQIQPFYPSQSFEMSLSRPTSTTCVVTRSISSSPSYSASPSFSASPSGSTLPINSEIELPDLEAMVNNLLIDS